MTRFLYLDTSSSVSLVAIGEDEEIIASEKNFQQMNQAAEINLMIERVLTTAKTKLKEIDCICVCAGPGSYTGLRVGMSTAKGIAFALDKSMMSFDRLLLMGMSLKKSLTEEQNIGVLLKARKGEYFWAAYSQHAKVIENPRHIFEEELDTIPKNCYVFTDVVGLPLENETSIISEQFEIDLNEWAKLTQERWQRNDLTDIAYSEPFYLKSAYTTTPKNKI